MRSTFTKITALVLSAALMFSANDVISFAKGGQGLREIVVADENDGENQGGSGGGELIEKPEESELSSNGTGDGDSGSGTGTGESGSDPGESDVVTPGTSTNTTTEESGTDETNTTTEEPSTDVTTPELDIEIINLEYLNQDNSEIYRDDNGTYFCKENDVNLKFQLEGAGNNEITMTLTLNEDKSKTAMYSDDGKYTVSFNVKDTAKDDNKIKIIIRTDKKELLNTEITIIVDNDVPILNRTPENLSGTEKKEVHCRKGESIKFKPTDMSGIYEVGMTLDEQKFDLPTPTEEGEYIVPFDEAFFDKIGKKEKIQCRIYAVDNVGKRTEDEFDILFDLTVPTISKNIYRVSDDIEITSETEDETNIYYTNDNCKIVIDASDENGENGGYTSGVAKVSIREENASEGEEFPPIQIGDDGKYTQVITFWTDGTKSQKKKTYIIEVEDKDGNITPDKFDIVFDNIGPSFEIDVFRKDGEEPKKEVNEYTDGKYYVNNNPSVEFEIKSAFSGIKDVTLTDVTLTDDGSTKPTESVVEGDDGKYSQEISNTDGEYVYKGAITDKAGNTNDVKINVVVSKKKPEIEVIYYDKDKKAVTVSEETNAYNNIAFISIQIKDCLFFTEENVKVGGIEKTEWDISEDKKEAWIQYQALPEKKYDLSVSYTDIALNSAESYSKKLLIDRTVPQVETYVFDKQSKEDKLLSPSLYYNSTKQIYLKIKESNFLDEKAEVTLIRKVAKDQEEKIPLKNLDWVDSADIHTADISFDRDGIYNCRVTCTDIAGNSETYSSGYFVIDTTKPKAEIEYKGIGQDGEKCYNEPVSAIIKVEETNLVREATVFTWGEGSEEAEVKNWSYDAKEEKHLCPVEFGKDGVYDFSVTLTDLAGNKETVTSGDPFVIDRTAPVIKVDFDTETTHGKYYSKPRTATITITEKNFISEKVNIEWLGASDKISEDLKLDWESEGDTHTAKLQFAKDGTYNFKVTCTDRAGNQEKTAFESGEFVIDKTKPIIKILKNWGEPSGKDNEGNDYYNTSQNIVFSVTEQNFDPQKVVITNIDGTVDVVLNKWESNEKKDEHTCTVELNQDGCYNFKVSCTDMAGNQADGDVSGKFYIDQTDPVIEVTFTDTGAKNEKYYNKKRTATIKITEKNFDEKKVVLEPVGASAALPAISGWSGSGGDAHTATLEFDKDGVYGFIVKYTDFAGRNGESNTINEFVIDKTEPSVDIEYDKNSPVNEKYHNAFRTAKVIVTDENFDEKCTMKFDITSDGEKPQIGKWTKSGASGSSQYTCEVFFDKDGEYSFKFSCEDLAGNKSNVENGGSFVIDTTKPEISVTYDNNNVKNGKYYNNSRTATITIKDKAFADNLVSVESLNPSGGNGLPSISAWTASGDTHTAKISFMEDGSYGFRVKCTDLADNAAKDYLGEVFIIDRSAPEIVFGGVRKNSANNGVAAPTLKCTDTYLDEAGTQIILTGTNHGQLSGIAQKNAIKDGIQMVYPDFEHTQDMDDFYTLTVKAVDLAGNETEDELNFSVNRFGSTYRISADTQKLVSGYYIGKAPTITVTEINIDELEYGEVTISKDGQTVTLKQGSDYAVAKEGEEENWKSYTYSIKPGNFAKDGVYSVGFYSKDKASNTSDNRIKGKEIEFALDTTAPSIVADGIESGMTYNEKSREVTVDVKDNMFLTSLTVTDNDETLIDMSEKELAENGGIVTFTLDEADGLRDVVITAMDKVNNVQKLEFLDVLITSKKEVITTIENEKAIIDTEDNIVKSDVAGAGIALPSYDEDDSLLYMVIEVMSAAVLITAVVTFYRKKRKVKN